MNRVVIALFIFAVIATCEGIYWDTIHVEIVNYLDPPSDVIIHCKSGDDDLGIHELPRNGTFGFHFKPAVFTGTLFDCSFVWPLHIEWFDIYVHLRDECDHCTWRIKATGPCMYQDMTKRFDLCYPWNKKKKKKKKLASLV